jgi:pyridoxamine 5'-phosphate oxidase
VSGAIRKVSREESDAYFRSRPPGSRLGAWASTQSAVIPSRGSLEEKLREAKARFGDGDVPLPDHWGGYRLVPAELEFWQGRESRLHDRQLFEREGDGWRRSRLSP